MTSATRERDRKLMYSHPASQARRQPEKADPIADLRRKHRDEKNELGARQRREAIELENKFDQEQARDRYANRSADEQKRRDALQRKHTDQRVAMEKRHREEIEAASKKHPVQ